MLSRLPLLGYRAAAIALAQLDRVTAPIPTRIITLNAEDAVLHEQERIAAKLSKNNKNTKNTSSSSSSAEDALKLLASGKVTFVNNNSNNSSKNDVAPPLTISQLQSASAVARFSSDLLSHFHALDVTEDKTLWLQFKHLALKVAPHASSAELVVMLEVLARRSACGAQECKAFQVHLGADVAALHPTLALRFAAACSLVGAPLQENMRACISQNFRSWLQSTALCPVWWILADVADQLQLDVRREMAQAIVAAVEQFRTSHHHPSSSSSSSSSSYSHQHQHQQHQIWPHCDRDTAFILFRLRSSGPLSITKGSAVPKQCNPVYGEALLATIRVDKVHSARCAVFLLRALCLGLEGDSSLDAAAAASSSSLSASSSSSSSSTHHHATAFTVLAEDLCRLFHNNLTSNNGAGNIHSAAVLVSIVHSLAGDRISVAKGVPSATIAGVEAAIACLKKHQSQAQTLRRETALAMLKILVAATQHESEASFSFGEGSDADGATTTAKRLSWLKDKLKGALNRAILLTPVEELHELLSLAEQAGVLTLRLADFALQLMQSANSRGGGGGGSEASTLEPEGKSNSSSSNSSSSYEIRRIMMMMMQNMLSRASEEEQKAFLKDSVYSITIARENGSGSSSSSSSSCSQQQDAYALDATLPMSSRFSLVAHWSEIRMLPAPKLAYYAAAAAKILFCDPASAQSNAVLAPTSQTVSTTSLMLGGATNSSSSNINSSGGSSSSSSFSSSRRGATTSSSFSNNSSSSASFHSAASGATMTTSSSSSLDGGLVGLCSAQSEIVQAHRGTAGLSASDAAQLVASTSMLPVEARALVLRDPGRADSVSSSPSSSSSHAQRTMTPRVKLATRKQQQQQQQQPQNTASQEPTISADDCNKQKQQAADDDGEETSVVLLGPLFAELVTTTKFLEAQCSVNSSLDLNSGSDPVLFASAQQRLSRLIQSAHPAPFEFAEHPLWIFWVTRLVTAIALHRLANFRLPLWMQNVVVEAYPRLLTMSMRQKKEEGGSMNTASSPPYSLSVSQQFRAMRLLYALSWFGLDQPPLVETVVRASCLVNSGSSSSSGNDAAVELRGNISPRGLLYILRMLQHLGQRSEFATTVHTASSARVEAWLGEYTTLMEQRQKKKKEQQQQQHQQSGDSEVAATALSSSSTEADVAVVSTFTAPSSSSRNTSSSVFKTRERRRLFDVLCCAAFLDLAPASYKHLIEHLYPFDAASLFPLPDAIFFFGVAAQQKRLSGFSLRVWRSLSMQLDKVTVPIASSDYYNTTNSANNNNNNAGHNGSSSSTAATVIGTGAVSAGGGAVQQTLSLVPAGAQNLVSQSAISVHPTFLSIGNFLAYGGGSASIDLLVEKLKRLQPFDPLLLATMIRVALHSPAVKVRPALSHLLCGAFDFTAAESFTSSDLVVVIETFKLNNAQRVAVGLLQADAAVSLAWEALAPRIVVAPSSSSSSGLLSSCSSSAAVSDQLFLHVAQIAPCPAKHVAEVVARRILRMANDQPQLLLLQQKRQQGNAVKNSASPKLVRDAVCKIVLSTFVKHIGHLIDGKLLASATDGGDVHEQQQHQEQQQREKRSLWEDIKTHILQPLVESSDNTAERESLEELLSL